MTNPDCCHLSNLIVILIFRCCSLKRYHILYIHTNKIKLVCTSQQILGTIINLKNKSQSSKMTSTKIRKSSSLYLIALQMTTILRSIFAYNAKKSRGIYLSVCKNKRPSTPDIHLIQYLYLFTTYTCIILKRI